VSDVRPVTVIALHGNGGGGFRFSRVPAVDGIDLRTPTLPGFAAEARDPALRTMADWAALVARWCDEITAADPDGRRPVLLGHGIGGSLVLEVLRHRADAVAGVILHAPVGAGLDRRKFPRFMQLPGVRPLVRWMIASRPLRPVWRRRFFHQPVPAAFMDRFFGEYRHCATFGDWFDLITAPWFASLRPVEVPAVLLWGAGERLLGPEQIDAFRPLLPRASVRVVEGWDHFPMIEQPDEYGRVVAECARELDGAGA
jgi:pimeloyl-ACP methyl ester carboxylesterase